MIGIEKKLTPTCITFDFASLGLATIMASRLNGQIVRLGKIIQPGEEGHPAEAKWPLYENCMGCGGFALYQHVTVRPRYRPDQKPT